MSKFLEKIDRHQEEVRKQLEGAFPMTYDMMQEVGLLKPTTFRLPAPTIAKLDELVKYGPWNSKQEMIYELFEEVIEEFINSPGTGELVRDHFHQVSKSAFDEWKVSSGFEETA
jgi:Arc/MetJ-type ribon-helix-helix transcriptional regulator